MKNYLLVMSFLILLGLSFVSADYSGTFNVNVGNGVQITIGNPPYVNVTNSTSSSSSSSSLGGGGTGVTGITNTGGVENLSNQNQTANFTPINLNGGESTYNSSGAGSNSSSSSIASGAINLAGNVVKALGSPAGLSILGIVVVGLGTLAFVFISRKRKVPGEETEHSEEHQDQEY